jgi:hypothetical protein
MTKRSHLVLFLLFVALQGMGQKKEMFSVYLNTYYGKDSSALRTCTCPYPNATIGGGCTFIDSATISTFSSKGLIKTSYTNYQGNCILSLPEGKYTITITKKGFDTATGTVVLLPGGNFEWFFIHPTLAQYSGLAGYELSCCFFMHPSVKKGVRIVPHKK